MENYALFLYIGCIALVVFIGRSFLFPIKRIFKLIVNSLLGAGLIWITNLIGTNYNFHIGINIWTVLCTGLLGIPGFILIILLKFLMM